MDFGPFGPCPQGLNQNSKCVPPVFIHKVITCDRFKALAQKPWRSCVTITKKKKKKKKDPEKVRENSRECHNHKPQPFSDPKRKRKPTNLNKHKPNKRTKSIKISSLFPKRGNRNTKRTEKNKNKMTTERHTTNRLGE